ncbi:MAG TPA: hypothetical protein VMV44_15135 [Rectinemataceae bacterium]|nr:hypothetical protein [Rectinemataceae bacterium]
MRCERFLLRFDELEPGQALPASLALHMSRCASCRAQVSAFESALSAWKRDESLRFDELEDFSIMEDRTMAAVRLTPRPRRELSLAQWAFPGFLVAISCIFLPIFARLQGVGDDALFFPLAIVFGLALSVFGLVFAGTHAEELKSELEKRSPYFFGLPR